MTPPSLFRLISTFLSSLQSVGLWPHLEAVNLSLYFCFPGQVLTFCIRIFARDLITQPCQVYQSEEEIVTILRSTQHQRSLNRARLNPGPGHAIFWPFFTPEMNINYRWGSVSTISCSDSPLPFKPNTVYMTANYIPFIKKSFCWFWLTRSIPADRRYREYVKFRIWYLITCTQNVRHPFGCLQTPSSLQTIDWLHSYVEQVSGLSCG